MAVRRRPSVAPPFHRRGVGRRGHWRSEHADAIRRHGSGDVNDRRTLSCVLALVEEETWQRIGNLRVWCELELTGPAKIAAHKKTRLS